VGASHGRCTGRVEWRHWRPCSRGSGSPTATAVPAGGANTGGGGSIGGGGPNVPLVAGGAALALTSDAFPTASVYGRAGYPSLRLITCGGPFDQATGHYVDNIIVYAHLVAG